ncbi:unnamed protein product [Cyprideis torosa]|uniref:Uncharacterized protein n=1 Tax=Cyprideis torosa TaxID=163714 RepID=A0A7R8ZT06_9CRUS|nr:unnamed protein product [Cyprideis torosa]CAG0896841.1 unnamed protein product [Cyprideis torosa]
MPEESSGSIPSSADEEDEAMMGDVGNPLFAYPESPPLCSTTSDAVTSPDIDCGPFELPDISHSSSTQEDKERVNLKRRPKDLDRPKTEVDMDYEDSTDSPTGDGRPSSKRPKLKTETSEESPDSSNSTGENSSGAPDCPPLPPRARRDQPTISSNEDEQEGIRPMPPLRRHPHPKHATSPTRRHRKSVQLRKQNRLEKWTESIDDQDTLRDDLVCFLREFTQDFLRYSFDCFVRSVIEAELKLLKTRRFRKNMKTTEEPSENTGMFTDVDAGGNSFWLIGYLLRLATLIRLEFPQLKSVLSPTTFCYLTYRGLSLCQEAPPWDRHTTFHLHLVVRCIHEFLSTIRSFGRSTAVSESEKRSIREIRMFVASSSMITSLLPLILASTEDQQLQEEVILVCHVVMLEVHSFMEAEGRQEFIDNLSMPACMSRMGALLCRYPDNSQVLNVALLTFMHHVGASIKKPQRLLHSEVVDAFASICEKGLPCSESFKDVIEMVLRLFLHYISGPKMQPPVVGSNSSQWSSPTSEEVAWLYMRNARDEDPIGRVLEALSSSAEKLSREHIVTLLLREGMIVQEQEVAWLYMRNARDEDPIGRVLEALSSSAEKLSREHIVTLLLREGMIVQEQASNFLDCVFDDSPVTLDTLFAADRRDIISTLTHLNSHLAKKARVTLKWLHKSLMENACVKVYSQAQLQSKRSIWHVDPAVLKHGGHFFSSYVQEPSLLIPPSRGLSMLSNIYKGLIERLGLGLAHSGLPVLPLEMGPLTLLNIANKIVRPRKKSLDPCYKLQVALLDKSNTAGNLSSSAYSSGGSSIEVLPDEDDEHDGMSSFDGDECAMVTSETSSSGLNWLDVVQKGKATGLLPLPSPPARRGGSPARDTTRSNSMRITEVT